MTKIDDNHLKIENAKYAGWLRISEQTEHYSKFSINARFNTQINLKDNVMLQFSMILDLLPLTDDLMPGFRLKLIRALI